MAIIFVLVSLSIIGFLLYRIIDTGVSLTFAQEEIEQLNRTNEVVVRYHRTRCKDFDDEVAAESFEKDGFLVIGGVEFLCQLDEDGVSRLFAQ
jgi:hypothetical protein